MKNKISFLYQLITELDFVWLFPKILNKDPKK